jgi:hypothetical protein
MRVRFPNITDLDREVEVFFPHHPQRQWGANHSLQAPVVMARASVAAFPPTMHGPRQPPLSLSLGVTSRAITNHRQMSMKMFLPVLAIVLFCTEAFSREHEYWPYDRLTKEADLIVIAVPLSTRDTAEKTTLPGIWHVDTNNVRSLIPAIGVETTFTALAVLKGDANTTKVVFHHLRETVQRLALDGPGLVAFDPKEKKTFLLFLKRESDGRYAPLTGQTDPDGSVKVLGDIP